VNGRYLPTVLSWEKIIGVITTFGDSTHIEAVAASLNYENLGLVETLSQ